MNVTLPHEAYCMEMAAAAVLAPAIELTDVQQRLHQWQEAVTHTLAQHRLQAVHPLKPTHALAHQVQQIQAQWAASVQTWEQQWMALLPARQLAQVFEDCILLLVFGKFNAGKSSLCNFLACRWAAHGQAVRFFRWMEGAVVWSDQPFREGATETTACLQGVCLGRGLVLLDTPGLHSVTPENAALTQCFTDSADAVLWLTSSTSPGQVQELNELARELHRHKPLQPVITRSDIIEEDECDGEIVQQWRNKTPANRRMQEHDVQQRTQDKLRDMGVDGSLLREPVSISISMAREHGQTEQALCEAGLLRFYAALRHIIEPARHYRRRKPAEVWLHHLDEQVLGAIEQRMVPALSCLAEQLGQERERLQELRPRLMATVWRVVMPEWPHLLERYAPTGDGAAVCREVSQRLQSVCRQQCREQLPDYDLESLSVELGAMAVPPGVGYDRLPGILQEAVHTQLLAYWDAVLKYCGQALVPLESQTRTLQDWMGRQRPKLQSIEHRLRGLTKP